MARRTRDLNNTQRLILTYSGLRAAYGIGLLAAPVRVARPWLGDVSRAPSLIPTRGLGARELALCAGATAAVFFDQPVHPWMAACVLSDAADLTATLAAKSGQLPSRSKVGTVLAAGTFGMIAAALAQRARTRTA